MCLMLSSTALEGLNPLRGEIEKAPIPYRPSPAPPPDGTQEICGLELGAAIAILFSSPPLWTRQPGESPDDHRDGC
jgi:hypothetical protein